MSNGPRIAGASNHGPLATSSRRVRPRPRCCPGWCRAGPGRPRRARRSPSRAGSAGPPGPRPPRASDLSRDEERRRRLVARDGSGTVWVRDREHRVGLARVQARVGEHVLGARPVVADGDRRRDRLAGLDLVAVRQPADADPRRVERDRAAVGRRQRRGRRPGWSTLTTNVQRPGLRIERRPPRRPCVYVRASLGSGDVDRALRPEQLPSGSIRQPISSVPGVVRRTSATPTAHRGPAGTSNANVSAARRTARRCRRCSVPSNEPPCRSTGTSERRTTGTTVWSPELSEITRS